MKKEISPFCAVIGGVFLGIVIFGFTEVFFAIFLASRFSGFVGGISCQVWFWITLALFLAIQTFSIGSVLIFANSKK